MFFFFQAEDGIRDYDVTGVQTCALLILQSDKKKQGKNLNFIVLEQIGKAKKVSNLKKEIVLEAIKNSLLPA